MKENPASPRCPLPAHETETVLLGHGSGGRMSADLVRRVFLPALGNPILARLNDSAEIEAGGVRLAFTTDSFVVSPPFFPGGDLGSIAVNGTVNDLAVSGARPLCLSAAFILEEGFPIRDLEQLVRSMRAAAESAGVDVVAADTKVVEHGKADGVFVTTSGVGVLPPGVSLDPTQIRAGDTVVVSGPIGDHGIAVLSAREGLEFGTAIVSDSAALHPLVSAMLDSGAAVRCMRDPTRGGVATTLNELAHSAGVTMVIEEAALPLRDGVRAACEMLGLDPLYVACEGRVVAAVHTPDTERLLAAMRAHRLGREARVIGRVEACGDVPVLLRTAFGTTRVVDVLPGAQLPRIC